MGIDRVINVLRTLTLNAASEINDQIIEIENGAYSDEDQIRMLTELSDVITSTVFALNETELSKILRRKDSSG